MSGSLPFDESTGVTGRRNRPAAVTLAVVFLILSAVFSIIAGFLLIGGAEAFAQAQDLDAGTTQSVFTFIAVSGIVVAVILLISAIGLLRGSRVARIIVTVLLVLEVAQSVWSLIQTQNWATEIPGILLPLLILYWLYRADSNQFFAKSVR